VTTPLAESLVVDPGRITDRTGLFETTATLRTVHLAFDPGPTHRTLFVE
jgi:hypothetical protein